MRFPSKSLGSGGASSDIAPLERIGNRRESGLRIEGTVLDMHMQGDENGWLKGRKDISLCLCFDYLLLQ